MQFPVALKSSPPPCPDVAEHTEKDFSSMRRFVGFEARIPPPCEAEQAMKIQFETYWLPDDAVLVSDMYLVLLNIDDGDSGNE